MTRQALDGAEHEFASLLVEDRNNEAQAYQEFLAYLHRQINLEVILSRNVLTYRRVEIDITTRIACGERNSSHDVDESFDLRYLLTGAVGIFIALSMMVVNIHTWKSVYCPSVP
jgi:hypothetical protein